jgi:hypothetical protein
LSLLSRFLLRFCVVSYSIDKVITAMHHLKHTNNPPAVLFVSTTAVIAHPYAVYIFSQLT